MTPLYDTSTMTQGVKVLVILYLTQAQLRTWVHYIIYRNCNVIGEEIRGKASYC